MKVSGEGHKPTSFIKMWQNFVENFLHIFLFLYLAIGITGEHPKLS
jgi:hypothetical protein